MGQYTQKLVREMLEYHSYYQHLTTDKICWCGARSGLPQSIRFILQSNSFERLRSLMHVLVSPHFSVLQMTKAE